MFKFLKKKQKGDYFTFKISGMHCTSCAMSIDNDLEDIDGVLEANTSYPKSETKVILDPQKTTADVIKKVIEKLGYKVEKVESSNLVF